MTPTVVPHGRSDVDDADVRARANGAGRRHGSYFWDGRVDRHDVDPFAPFTLIDGEQHELRFGVWTANLSMDAVDVFERPIARFASRAFPIGLWIQTHRRGR